MTDIRLDHIQVKDEDGFSQAESQVKYMFTKHYYFCEYPCQNHSYFLVVYSSVVMVSRFF